MKSQIDQYQILERLGKGQYAKVKRAFDSVTCTEVALKIMRIKREFKSSPIKIQELRNLFLSQIFNEIQAVRRLNHPNIVHILQVSESSVYHSKRGRSWPVPYIVMELMPNGELFNVLCYAGRPFEEELARVYFRQLLEVVGLCHSQGITHRDIKPENVLFDAQFNLKLTDFGFAIPARGRDGTGWLRTQLGTYEYMAPEILMQEPYSGVSVDLFACGLILFIMLSRHPACSRADQSDGFYSLFLTDNEKFWLKHEKPNPAITFSPEFRSLINGMLAFSPEERLSLQQILAHPWVNGVSYTVEQARVKMAERYQDAEQRKAAKKAEKEAKDVKKLIVRSARGYRDAIVDSSGSSSSGSNMSPTSPLSLLPFNPGTNKFSRIFTSLSAERLMTLLAAILADMQAGILTKSEEKFKFVAKVQTDFDSVTLGVELLEVEDGTICVDFTKEEGATYEFVQVFNEVKTLFLKATEE